MSNSKIVISLGNGTTIVRDGMKVPLTPELSDVLRQLDGLTNREAVLGRLPRPIEFRGRELNGHCLVLPCGRDEISDTQAAELTKLGFAWREETQGLGEGSGSGFQGRATGLFNSASLEAIQQALKETAKLLPKGWGSIMVEATTAARLGAYQDKPTAPVVWTEDDDGDHLL